MVLHVAALLPSQMAVCKAEVGGAAESLASTGDTAAAQKAE